MVDAKIIAPSRYFAWMDNLVVVRKKNGGIRLCVDFKNLKTISQGQLSSFKHGTLVAKGH
jgi:hypothetical protein